MWRAMLAWVVCAGALFATGPHASDQHVLDVPYRRQLDGSAYALANCGPTSLSMVLAYYGVDASAWDLRVRAMKAQHSWVSDDGGYSDSYGAFVSNLASVAQGMGLRVDAPCARQGGPAERRREREPAGLRPARQAQHPGDRQGCD